METWLVWSELNKRLMLKELVPFVSFQIRDALTPANGFLQVMIASCQEEERSAQLHAVLERLQEMEAIVLELIAMKNTERLDLSHAAWMPAMQETTRLLAHMRGLQDRVVSTREMLLSWQQEAWEPDLQRFLNHAIESLTLAEKWCGQLNDLT